MRRVRDEEGAVVVMAALLMVVMVGFVALVVDYGMVLAVRTELRTAADASALAGASGLPEISVASGRATNLALDNHSQLGVGSIDVQFGRWDEDASTFIVSASSPDAVKVTVSRTAATGNAVQLAFASVLGRTQADVTVSAVVVRGGGGGTKFLIDDEAFDTDVPAIEDLAAALGTTSDFLLSDTDGDGFIQLSNVAAGVVLELPTGQVGDAGLFDIDPGGCQFPFPGSGHSFEDFIRHEVFGSIIDDDDLDPLVCVRTVENPLEYPSYVNPNSVQVSPLYKSDISTLNPVGGDPAINAKGERRGLVAFRVIGVGADPDGAGSVLPNLIFRIEGPQPLNGLSPGDSGGGVRLVQ